MKDCIFCKIVVGKVPCHKVYEDKDFLGFLDAKPQSSGHSLVIPKKHYRWVDDVPNFGKYFEAAKKVSLAIKEALQPKLVCYLVFGMDVFHAHIQVIPRFLNDGHTGVVDASNVKNIPEEEMRKIAEKIRERAKNIKK